MSKSIIKGIIWDLDETLVDTAALKKARNSRNWDYVYENLGKTKLYDGIKDIYDLLRSKYKIAIVTNSPSEYAKKLTRTYNLDSDILNGFSRLYKPKPDPAQFIRTAKMFSLKEEEMISIGDSIVDLQTSIKSKIEFIGVGWGEAGEDVLREHGAIYIAKRPKDIIDILNKL